MKIKGTETTTKTVDVEISDLELKRVVSEQSVEFLAKVLEDKLKRAFLHSLEPKFSGSRTIRPSWKTKSKGCLALVHIDATWDYHNNKGEDEEVRLLTEDEEERYKILCNLARTIADLQK